MSTLACALFVALIAASLGIGGGSPLAIYALSFWHYLLYALAYRFGAIPLAVFKRDAVLMKTVALVALGTVYFAAPLDIASLAVVAGGFLLNVVAAAVLGSDRTYYGYEVADLPRRRVIAFPYSLISHPMLIGNVVAFGGTLINPEFRQEWWPLACAHMAFNLGLLVMERAVTPLRLSARATANGGDALRPCYIRVGLVVVAAGALGAAAGASGALDLGVPIASALGSCIVLLACVLFCRYAGQMQPPGERGKTQREGFP